MKIWDRRTPTPDQARLAQQREVTRIILVIFAATVANVLMSNDSTERSTILQVVVNLAMLAAGYWLGSMQKDKTTQVDVPPTAPAAGQPKKEGE